MDRCRGDFGVAVHRPRSLVAVPTALLYMVNLRSDSAMGGMLLRTLDAVILVGTDCFDCGSFFDMRNCVQENSSCEQF